MIHLPDGTDKSWRKVGGWGIQAFNPCSLTNWLITCSDFIAVLGFNQSNEMVEITECVYILMPSLYLMKLRKCPWLQSTHSCLVSKSWLSEHPCVLAGPWHPGPTILCHHLPSTPGAPGLNRLPLLASLPSPLHCHTPSSHLSLKTLLWACCMPCLPLPPSV